MTLLFVLEVPLLSRNSMLKVKGRHTSMQKSNRTLLFPWSWNHGFPSCILLYSFGIHEFCLETSHLRYVLLCRHPCKIDVEKFDFLYYYSSVKLWMCDCGMEPWCSPWNSSGALHLFIIIFVPSSHLIWCPIKPSLVTTFVYLSLFSTVISILKWK